MDMNTLHDIELREDTRLNAASLLLEPVGSTRDVGVTLSTFPLDSDLMAHDVEARLRLTRLRTGVLAQGAVEGAVELECARCLTVYVQPFSATFSEQFRQSVDVRSGAYLPGSPEDDGDDNGDEDEAGFTIDEAHQLELGELLRQWILLALPMRPDCGDLCPGPPEIAHEQESMTDQRFAALERLLHDDE